MKVIYFKPVFLTLFFVIISGFNSINNVLFESEKVILYMNKGGIRMNFLFDNFKEDESMKIDYAIYTEPKVLIGTETSTKNKELLKQYRNKYKTIALNGNKNKHDISYSEDKFKIVEQDRNGKLYFYYYLAKIHGSKDVQKTSFAKNIYDPSWHYIGANKFLIDIKINHKLVMSKIVDLEDNMD